MLFDDPASILEDLLFGPEANLVREEQIHGLSHRLWALTNLHSINIVCTELQEKRLILAANDAAWSRALARSLHSTSLSHPEHKPQTTPIHPHGYLHLNPLRPEDAMPVLLLNEERAEFEILPVHRFVPDLGNFVPGRFLDQARLFFHIEHLPAPITAERIEYLLTHGNELGPAMIALVAKEAYLFKARLDVIAAIFHPERSETAVDAMPAPPDTAILELLLRRTLHCDLASTRLAETIPDTLHAAQLGATLAFCLNPPSLLQIQNAALHSRPLPANTFRIQPQPPDAWIDHLSF